MIKQMLDLIFDGIGALGVVSNWIKSIFKGNKKIIVTQTSPYFVAQNVSQVYYPGYFNTEAFQNDTKMLHEFSDVSQMVGNWLNGDTSHYGKADVYKVYDAYETLLFFKLKLESETAIYDVKIVLDEKYALYISEFDGKDEIGLIIPKSQSNHLKIMYTNDGNILKYKKEYDVEKKKVGYSDTNEVILKRGKRCVVTSYSVKDVFDAGAIKKA